MHVNQILNSAVSLDTSPSPGSLHSHWLGQLPSSLDLLPFLLALKVLLNPTPKVESLRVKVKSHKEVGHLTKFGWSSQGTLVGHLKLVMLKEL